MCRYRCNTCVADTCVMFYTCIHLKYNTCITGVAQLAMYVVINVVIFFCFVGLT